MTKSLPPKSLVLYADDDTDDLELVSEAFAQYSAHVHLLTFKDGAELLHYVRHLDPLHPKPCLFVIDINMPRINGKETLKLLRGLEHYNSVPAILFSTSTLPADAQFARSLNAGFITKPLNANQVLHVIDQMVEHCSAEVKKRIRK